MTEARIKSSPDNELQYRSQTVIANNKTLVTPVKSIDPKHIETSIKISKQVTGLNEMYSGFTSKKISDHINEKDKSAYYLLNSVEKSLNPKDMQLCFLEYKEEEFPSKKEIEFLTDLAYVHSDVTPIPMLSSFTDRIVITKIVDGKKQHSPNDSVFRKFLKYLSDAVETIQQLNNKPIMGYIPDYRFYFDELVEFYVKRGINTFYYDAHLSNPITLQSSLRALLRELNNQETLEHSFVHMLNPGYGRASKDSAIIPAKDILGFGLGVDGIGERHMKRVFNKQLAEYMKKNPDNRARLFDKDSYGYLKTSDKSEIQKFYPNDSGIDIANFLTGKKPSDKLQNSFNVEQLALESSRLRDRLNSSKSVLDYITKKTNIKEDDLKILKRAKIKDKK